MVSVVGVDGQVRHSYGPSQTSGVGLMKYPRGLAVTKNDDILVTDNVVVACRDVISIKSSMHLP